MGDQPHSWPIPIILSGSFTFLTLLEFSTPPEYVIGYLYIGPILWSAARLSSKTTLVLTSIATGLTFLDAGMGSSIQTPILVSRAIAVVAMAITAALAIRNQTYAAEITQQQTKLKAQETLNDVREDFASTLTHDLKTPLLGGIETLKALQSDTFGPTSAQQQQVLATLIRSHDLSLKLLETLLDIYRNDTEGLQLQLAPLNLVQLTEDATAALINFAASRRVHLSCSYGDSDFRKFLWVNGDALQLQRVLANLLTNAIHHAPRGSHVEIVLESHAALQTVKILDSGAGISDSQMPYLFERFYQGHSDRQSQGSGLGLYLTRQIITAHGGTIWAENRSPQGAIFSFCLPALPAP